MRILVTGSSGFVGRALVARFAADGHQVFAAARSTPSGLPPSVRALQMNSLGTGASPLADSCSPEVVVHAAARVHVMHENASDALARIRAVNVDGSVALARQMLASGARRFVYLSSIKVLGESSPPGKPFTAEMPPAPADAYGQSKFEAERALADFCQGTGMELVVIRPPLVYGPGVKANFDRLMRAVARRRPLPFGRLEDNRRSLVALDNLVDLIVLCAGHPASVGGTFLVSDDEDLSTAELVRRLARTLGVAPRLLPVPTWALELAGTLLVRRDAIARLAGSLQVDIEATRRRLGWRPGISVDEGLARAAAPILTGARS